MEKKKFSQPIMELCYFSVQDVLSGSPGPVGLSGFDMSSDWDRVGIWR